MLVTKCDICGKEIEGKKMVTAAIGSWIHSNSYCLNCGKPVVEFLNKIKDKNEKRKK